MDELSFAAAFKPGPPTSAAEVLARRLATPDPEELREAVEAKRAADARAELAETRRMINAMNGDPLGQLSLAQSEAASARDVVQDLEEQLSRGRERLQRAAERMVDLGQAADQVLARSVQQSDGADLLAGPRKILAEERVERMLARAAAQPVSRSRPFARRGGDAGPGEPTCPECIAAGASAEESWMIHNDPAPDPVPDDWEPELDWLTERHAYSRSREVIR